MADLSKLSDEELLGMLGEHQGSSGGESPTAKNIQNVAELILKGQPSYWVNRGLEEGNKAIAEGAYKAGGSVTDMTGSPLAGYATNVGIQAIPNLLMMRAFSAPGSATETPAKWLMQSAVKPSKSALESGDAGRAFKTMLQEGISPTGSSIDKASKLAHKLNAATDAAISASPETVNIKRVAGRLLPSYQRAMAQVNPQADMDAIEAARKAFVSSPLVAGEKEIPVALAQKIKSGTYASIGDKAYGELGSASVEAQKQLARGLREEVIKKVPEIADKLKRESSLRNVMEVVSTRAAQDANKNPLSLGTSIAAIMHDPLAAAGMWANASTRAKALMAHLLYQGGRPEMSVPLSNVAQRIPDIFDQE